MVQRSAVKPTVPRGCPQTHQNPGKRDFPDALDRSTEPMAGLEREGHLVHDRPLDVRRRRAEIITVRPRAALATRRFRIRSSTSSLFKRSRDAWRQRSCASGNSRDRPVRAPRDRSRCNDDTRRGLLVDHEVGADGKHTGLSIIRNDRPMAQGPRRDRLIAHARTGIYGSTTASGGKSI